MTIGEYLQSLIESYTLSATTIQRAAESPCEVSWKPFDVDEERQIPYPDEAYRKRLAYASSVVYYSAMGIFSGGGLREQIGDVSFSEGSYQITMADRERFQALGDQMRSQAGFTPLTDKGGMSDWTQRRKGL